jgi:hypothetical protein
MGQTVPQHQGLQLYKRKQSTLGHPKLAAIADLGKFLSVPLAALPQRITYQSYWIIFHELDFQFEEPRGVQKPRTNGRKKNINSYRK